LCGRRKNSSPTSGDGHNRLKNWPGVTESALDDAATTRCLYSALIQSWDTTGQSDSSAAICDGAVTPTGALPTTFGAEANSSPFIAGTSSVRRQQSRQRRPRDGLPPSQNQDLFQFLNRSHSGAERSGEPGMTSGGRAG